MPYLDDVAALTAALMRGDNLDVGRAVERLAWQPPAVLVRQEPSIRLTAAVFERDKYQCRYCGQKVVLTAVLRLLSRAYPDVLPYYANWAAGRTQDHVQPVTLGGPGLDEANIFCACWRCNRRKGDLSLGDLAWTLRHPEHQAWHGLADVYVRLWDSLLGRRWASTNVSGWVL